MNCGGSDKGNADAGALSSSGVPSSAHSTFTLSPATVAADGKATTTLTVTVLDESGAPVSGQQVTLVPTGIGNVLSDPSDVTNESGVVTSTLSSAFAQTETVGASVGTFVLQSPTITFTSGAVSDAHSRLVAGRDDPAADGVSQLTLTATFEDADGNALSGQTVAFAASGSGNVLSTTSAVTNAQGVATTNLASTVAQIKTVTAVSGTTTLATQVQFVPGPPANAVFTTQPTTTPAGSLIAPTVVVTLEDKTGNAIVSDSSTPVVLTLGGGTSGAVLSGPSIATAVNGVATFPGLSIDKPGTSYALSVTAQGYTSTTSATFQVNVGLPANAIFTVPPVTAAAGTHFAPALVVTLQDASGNTIRFGDSATVVVMSIGYNAGGGTLSGTVSTAVHGKRPLPILSINKVGFGYTLTATAAGYQGSTSSQFTIVPGRRRTPS